MFTEIFLFELKYRIKRPATWIYFGVFLGLGFLMMYATAGKNDAVSVAFGDSSRVLANAPYRLLQLVVSIAIYGTLIISAIVGNPVFRDFEHRMHPLMFTKPITKFGYLGGRFLGSSVIAVMVLLSIPLGLWLGTISPWAQPDKIGAFNLMAYITPTLLFIIPNVIISGAIFFTMATLWRSMVPNYVGCVVLLVLYAVASGLAADLDNKTLAALLDPIGTQSFEEITRYWTPAEKNTNLMPIGGLVLMNRLLWTAFGLIILGIAFWRFKFTHVLTERKRKNTPEPQQQEDVILLAEKVTEEKEEAKLASGQRFSFPKPALSFSAGQTFRQLLQLTRIEFTSVVKNVFFIAIVFTGMLFLFLMSSQLGKIFDTPVFPVTYSVTSLLGAMFGIFMLIVIIFYAGEMIWRERGAKMNQITDAMPVNNGLFFASKLLALMAIQVLMMFVVMITGILIQTFKGYYNYELDVYFKMLFGVKLIYWWLLCVLALFVHVLVNNKYVGHFLVILVYILFNVAFPNMGLQHNLFRFGSDPGMMYSDMNGFGHFTGPFAWFMLYWSGFALLLVVKSNLFFVRGTETAFKVRRKLAWARFGGSMKLLTVTGLVIFLGTGSWIFYNTNVLNDYTTSKETEKELVRYENTYGKYRHIPQPKIVAVKADVDIFPETRAVKVAGTYILKNKTKTPIDSFHVQYPATITLSKLEFSRTAKRVVDDKKLGYVIMKTDQPLLPGDSLTMTFALESTPEGFTERTGGTQVVYNGTFFNSSYMPSIGYSEDGEIGDKDTREKYGLPAKPHFPSLYDTTTYYTNPLAADADWIRFEATVSTSDDQVAIAPGYLEKEWKANGRHYFNYKMDVPILNFYSFLSARYEVKRDKWNDVNIEIFYHKTHGYNVDRMIRSIKKSLDYYSKNFTPYQHKQVRIIEFPRYQTFAQSFPNTIPYSEGIGFIANIDDKDPESIDYVFYVIAHEVAHQWWGHQVVGAKTQGATFIIETMAQYSSLMVMEKEYGAEKMKKFLKYEMDNYLRGRSGEAENERPLMLVENQQYIHYNKGSVLMYALKDYIGEDSLNKALRGFLQKNAFQAAPYTQSLEFVDCLRKATPDSLKYIITDLFETITLYENKASGFTSKKQPDGTYKVTITVEAQKLRADSLGNEKEIAVNDWIDIGVFSRDKKTLYLQKHHITGKKTEIEVTVNGKPFECGIDPLNKLIDRHPDDNTIDQAKQYVNTISKQK